MSDHKTQDLIDRYVYDVTKRLPQEQRDDIEKELRGLIDDMLESRLHGAVPTQEDVIAVLKKLGRPWDLAAKYRGSKRYLIGPEYYDIYWLVVKIVLGATAFGMTIALIVSNITSLPQNAYTFVGTSIATLIGALVQAFAYVTIAFALAEHCVGKVPWKKVSWDPRDLPPAPTKSEKDTLSIKRTEPIVGLVFGVLGLVIFNAAPWLFGYVTALGDPESVPIFNLEVLRAMLVLINLLIGLSMLKDVLLLIAGRYTLGLSLAVVGITVAMLVLNIAIFLPPAIWNADFLPTLYARTGVELFASEGAQTFWTWLPTAIVVVGTIGYVSEIGICLYRGFRSAALKVKVL